MIQNERDEHNPYTQASRMLHEDRKLGITEGIKRRRRIKRDSSFFLVYMLFISFIVMSSIVYWIVSSW